MAEKSFRLYLTHADEAHRTQYKDLAENMRTGLPNAQFLAFTGTPLLGARRLTNAWFGDYVSEYNFAESIKDHATVPLYYIKRVPEVELKNDFLDSDFAEILEEEKLTDAEQRRLENHYAKELEVIKRDDRLDAIARANRVYGDKKCGLIIDYLDVFKYLKRALADYASDDNGLMPVKDIAQLLRQLNEAIDLTNAFCLIHNIDLSRVVEDRDTFKNLSLF